MKYFSLQRIKKEILQADSPPRITAISMAVGVALAFGPLPGLHLLVGFLLNRIFKLNAVIMLVGILIHNPWTMIPIHLLGLTIGDLVVHQNLVSIQSFRAFPWEDVSFLVLFNHSFWAEHGPALSRFMYPFAIGHLVVASTLGLLAYRLTHHFATRYRQ